MERNLLKSKDVISLRELNINDKDNINAFDESSQFEIISLLSQGSSAVCYEAKRNGEMGRLKEFYPNNQGSGILHEMKRAQSGQLVTTDERDEVSFYCACKNFINPYIMLNNVKNNNSKSRVLNNYMPPSTLYRGFEGEKPASVYVWTKADKEGVTFAEYIKQIHKSPKELCAHKLYNIITVLISITNFLTELHDFLILHLDMKPSNFLVNYDSKYNINPHSISVFDINSFYDMDSPLIFAGSEGYRAPELTNPVSLNDIDTYTDIYSVGAILYNALFSTKDSNAIYEFGNGLGDIENKISECDFIKNSEILSDIKIKTALARILKKCLAYDTHKRYQFCYQLKEDLLYVQARISTYESNSRLSTNEKLVIIDSEKNNNINPVAIIQDLLYNHPFYESSKDNGIINVVTFGAGNYSQKFIDQCLQCGQMFNTRLKITAVSDECDENMQEYLSFRRELKDFVNVSCNSDIISFAVDNYADLSFASLEGKLTENEDNNRILFDNALSNAGLDKDNIDYIFVSLGSDELNEVIAYQLKAYAPKRSTICFTRSGEAKHYDEIIPVYINKAITGKDISPQLTQMAFNTHLSWLGDGNIDIKKAKKEFRQKYNFDSSLAMALSVKYKLHSIGINSDNPEEAAYIFSEKVLNDNSPYFAELLCLEHKRWVLEKVCDGWSRKYNLEACLVEPTNDKKKKQHICIVKSNAELGLEKEPFFTNDDWDEAEHFFLDDLDSVSLELHRIYYDEAKKISLSDLINSECIIIKKIIENNELVSSVFSELEDCIKCVYEKCNYSDYSDKLREFKKSEKSLSALEKRQIDNRIRIVDDSVRIIFESRKYTDYKLIDKRIIEKIPFILTNK